MIHHPQTRTRDTETFAAFLPLRTTVSDLELLNFITNTSHLAANCPSASWRSLSDKSSAKCREVIPRPPKQKPSAYWLCLEILSTKSSSGQRVGPVSHNHVKSALSPPDWRNLFSSTLAKTLKGRLRTVSTRSDPPFCCYNVTEEWSTRTAPWHPEAEQLLIKGTFHISNGCTATEGHF